jgi:hypothetical protein
MRVFATTLLLALVAAPALAQDPDLLLYEGFDYTISETLSDNVLQGKIPTGYSNAWNKTGAPAPPAIGDDLQRVIADSFTYPGLAAPTGGRVQVPRDQNGNITRITIPGAPYNPGNASSIFFSFTMKLTSWATIDDGFDTGQAGNATQQAGILLGGMTASTAGGMSGANVYAGQLRIRREVDESGVQSNKYQFGFHKNNLSGGVATWDTTQSFAVDDLVLVVGEYQFNADGDDNTVTDDAVRLWINPIPGEAAGAENIFSNAGYDVSTAGGAGQSNASGFWFRSNLTAANPGDIEFDELRIGKTYASVTPAASVGANGDFNGDTIVDGADFLMWQRGESTNGLIDGDLQEWKDNFPASVAVATSVPEPSAWALGAIAALALGIRRRFVA